MHSNCLILTLYSVGIEHSDVVCIVPLRESKICSGVIDDDSSYQPVPGIGNDVQLVN